ncbi:MAG: molecular chaperone DnaJ [Gammaproteobacteria bacterium]|nr:molecular chaperone DnaJ [Gammaproteobacteria bacterium]
MFGRLLLILLLLFGIVLFFRHLNRLSAPQRQQLYGKFFLWGGASLLLLITLTGRLPWLFAVVAAIIPFAQKVMRLMQFAPLLHQLKNLFQPGRSAVPPPSVAFTANSLFLTLDLDQQKTPLSGDVLRGRYQGFSLGELTQPQLEIFWQECQADGTSQSLLENYLQQRFGDNWPQWGRKVNTEEPSAAPPPKTGMSQAEALEILGLDPAEPLNRKQITSAHRKLMQKVHPDRGGSDYLAAQINQAKRTLLAKKR